MSESCCGSSVYADESDIGRARKKESWKRLLQQYIFNGVMGSTPIPAGFYYRKGSLIG